MSRLSEEDRLLAVDAVRGIAMFFIGVSHISFYLINDSAALASSLRAIGFVATPNFLLMSGLACGYQLAASPTETAVRFRAMPDIGWVSSTLPTWAFFCSVWVWAS